MSSEDEYLSTNGENESDDICASILAIVGPSHCNDDGNFLVLNESLLYLSSKKKIENLNKRHLHPEKSEKEISSSVHIQT